MFRLKSLLVNVYGEFSVVLGRRCCVQPLMLPKGTTVTLLDF